MQVKARSMRFSIFGLIPVWAVLLCSAQCQVSEKFPQPKPAENSLIHSFSTLAKLCTQSRGVWHRSLRSCFCPSPMYFSARQGCSLFTYSNEKLGELGLRVMSSNGIAAKNMRDREISDLLQGVVVESASGLRSYFDLGLGNLSKHEIVSQLDSSYLPAGSGVYARYHLASLQRPPDISQNVGSRCRFLLKNSGEADDSESMRVCMFMENTMRRLFVDDLFADTDFLDNVRGSSPKGLQYSVAKLSADMGHAIYRQFGADYAIFMRTLQFNLGRDVILSVLLSPKGNVMGGVFEKRRYLAEGSSLVRINKVYFHGLFEEFWRQSEDFGDRVLLAQALVRWRAEKSTVPRTSKVRAMILERAIDLRASWLLPILDLSSSSVQTIAEKNDMSVPLFFGAQTPVDSVLQVLPETSSTGGQHGTYTATVLSHNLTNLSLTMFSHSDGGWMSKGAKEATDHLIRKIEHDCPSVVNISQTFEDELPNCADVFGTLFHHFEDTVLFVVGAGNDGVRNAKTMCPASLSPNHPNVLSVAGVDGDGKIYASDVNDSNDGSNYGKETVDIAAPFCSIIPTISNLGQGNETEVCGTSFAAPIVANWALRILQERPTLAPAQLRKLLLDKCEQSGLDVECGGYLKAVPSEGFIRASP